MPDPVSPPLTAESEALLAVMGKRHRRMLAEAVYAPTMGRQDWADMIGDEPVYQLRERLPAIEAAAAARALAADRVEYAALATDGTVSADRYHHDPVYHAVAYRMRHRGEAECDCAAADRERVLVAALEEIERTLAPSGFPQTGEHIVHSWNVAMRALAAPDAAGQREVGTSCEHGFSWDRSCDACGRIVSGLDEEEPV